MVIYCHRLFSKEVLAMTVEEYRLSLAWSASELARRAQLSPRTVARVENGEPVYAHTVAAIARALSEGLGKTVTVRDLKGVNIVE
jgi:transcriptional regulator with XRE-family HTH domain